MLGLLESLFILFEAVQMHAAFFCDEEMCSLGGAVDPINQENLFVVLFDGDDSFDGGEVDKKGTLDGEEEEYVFFGVVGEVGDEVGPAEVDEFEVVLVDDVDDVLVVDDGDVALEVEEVLAVVAEALLYLLQLRVLLRVDQLQQLLLLNHR